ncbi:MAG: winged helix-turn-helix domain-containing protein [Halobacteriales archaeon]
MDAPSADEIRPEEAFEILGHETRLSILHALLEEQEFNSPGVYPETPVSFTAIRKRVGMDDGSQFNYHLKQLVGRFVHQTEEGYVLRRPGHQIISAVLSGALTELDVLDEVPIVDPCPLCEGQVVLELGTERMLDWLISRCTSCAGGWRIPGLPSGVLMLVDPLEPVGMRVRNPDEMYRTLVTRTVADFSLVAKGICPKCSGPIDTAPLICEEHAVAPGEVCSNCDTIFQVRYVNQCDVCGHLWHASSDRHFVDHPTVHAFYHDHGYDPFGHDWLKIQTETIADQTIDRGEALTVETDIEVDGDRLTVILDADGSIVHIEER